MSSTPQTQRVLLGFPGDLIDPLEAPSLYRTKIGASPTVPVSFPKNCFDTARCGLCGNRLALVLQTHAPLSSQQSGKAQAERWLYVFGCVQKGCGRQSCCWRAFRLQLQHDTTAQTSKVADFKDSQRGMEQGDANSMNSLIYNGADSAPCQNPEDNLFSLEGLRAALESPASSKKKKGRHKSQKKRLTVQIPEESDLVEWSVELPDFYIFAEEEPDPKQRHSLPQADPHIQDSAEQYMLDSGDDVAWQGECYEKPKYETADGTAFVKFQRRVELAPKQCVRYHFDGAFLNPTNDTVQHLLCQSCGCKCVFELQLMPHLIHALYEAAEWLQAEATGSPNCRTAMAVQNAIVCSMEWEWATLAVFTCSQSCNASDPCTAITETLLVFNEPVK